MQPFVPRRPPRALPPAALLALVLAGCQGVPPEAPAPEPAPVARPAAAPATLPDAVPEQVAEDYEMALRQAATAWERGDHKSALLFYERVLGRAAAPREQVRALIGMATLRLMPASKVEDAVAAGVVMRELDRRLAGSDLRHEFFAQVELLRLLQAHAGEMQALRETNRKLSADLAAKNELVRQLRALSVGAD